MKKELMLLFVLIICSCSKEDITISRSFYMGYTVITTSEDSSNDFPFQDPKKSEIVHISFRERHGLLLDSSDNSFSSYGINKWSRIKSNLVSSQKIYLSVSPMCVDSGGLEEQNGQNEQDNLGRFHDPKIRHTYLNYCKQLIDFFSPAYFNMMENANQFFLRNPEGWPDLLSFHEYIYKQLKLCYPSLCVFSSVAAEPIVDGAIVNNDFVLQRLAVLQIIDHSDLYALSIKGDCINMIAKSKKQNAFGELLSISDKPVALSITDDSSRTDLLFESIELSKGMNSVLSSCLNRGAVFVVTDSPSEIFNTERVFVNKTMFMNETWSKYFFLNYK